MSAINQAVSDLSTEFFTVMRDPEKPIRIECDYFKQHPCPDVTPASVLAIVERRIAPTTNPDDVGLQSYVKWQLLSAVPDRFEVSLTTRAVQAYRRSPRLMYRPGVSVDDQRELEQLARGRMDDAAETIEHNIEARIGRFNKYNGPILKLRGALYKRLPVRYESIAAGVDDAFERVACGIEESETRPLIERLADDAREWMKGPSTNRETLTSLSTSVARLSKAKTTYYVGVKWKEDRRQLVWQTRTVSGDEKGTLSGLAADLTAAAARLDGR